MNTGNSDRREQQTRALQEIVADRIGMRWEQFASEHPNLSAAIERVRLIENGVRQLEREPAYREAMEAAGRDEAVLAASARLVGEIDKWVVRALGL
ncbi:MAG: hypothetical protein WD294_10455 [Phycisphaeraceae bacterium]